MWVDMEAEKGKKKKKKGNILLKINQKLKCLKITEIVEFCVSAIIRF